MTLLQRISAWLLAATLALGLGIVPATTPLLAAPVAQESGPAVMGYFESEIIPGEGDNPDLVVGLVLYEDGSAEVISDYQNEEDVITEVGTWVDNGDGTLTLTVTGTSDAPYAAPIELDFNLADDGSLVVPGSATGAFGEAGLVLLPMALGNSEAILAQIPADALVYQSDVLPAASGPGLQLTLAVFDDGSLTLISDYMNPGEIVVEIGTWSEAEDGSLLVSLTGQIENEDGSVTEYDAALEFVFTVNEDGSLALVDEGGALFGDAGLTLFPSEGTGAPSAEATEEEPAEEEATEETPEVAAGEEITATEALTLPAEITATEEITAGEAVTEEATAEETTEEDAEGEEATTDEPVTDEIATDAVTDSVPSGVYISELLAAEGSDGTFLVTVFREDGTIVFSTYPLNGDPVTEVGVWADNGDGTFVITATGTLAEEYDEPFGVGFTIDADGVVTISDIPLYPLAEIDLAGTPELVAEFTSALITDTIDLTHTMTLVAYDDASAELITTYPDTDEVYVEYGEWFLDESVDQLLVTITGDDETDYEEAVEWVFDVTTEDTLVLANDDEGYYGEDGLVLTAVVSVSEETGAGEAVAAPEVDAEAETDAEADAEADTEADAEAETPTETEGDATATEGVQIFQSEVLPAASSPGLQLTLGLLDDGSAAIDYDYMNDAEVITNLGAWVDNEDGTITLTFTEGPNGTLDLPIEFTLELDEDGNLVIIDASEESFGLIDVVLAPVVLE